MIEYRPGPLAYSGVAASVLRTRWAYGPYDRLPEQQFTPQEKLRNHREVLLLAADQNIVHDVFTKAVENRLKNPALSRKLTGKWVVTPLAREYQKVQSIFAEDEQRPESERRSEESLAKDLRGAVQTVYGHSGPEGMKTFKALKNEDIIIDARDFSGTVTRRFFTGEYLKRVANEQRISEEIQRQCKVDIDKSGERIDRHKIIIRILDMKKAIRGTRREMNRVKRHLGLTNEEREELKAAYASQQEAVGNIIIQEPLNQEDLEKQIEERKQLLQEKMIVSLSSESAQEEEVSDTEQPEIVHSDGMDEFANSPTVESTDNLFLDAAISQQNLYWSRQQLAKSAQSLKIGATVEAINIVQRDEAKVRGADRRLKGYEQMAKKNSGMQKILHHAKNGVLTASQEAYIRARVINQRVQNYFLRNFWKYQDFIYTRVKSPNIDRVSGTTRRTKYNIYARQNTRKMSPQKVAVTTGESHN